MALAGALAAMLALAFVVAPGAALAAAPGQAKPTTPPALTAVQIVGEGIAGKIVVPSDAQAALFQRMLTEVSWLANSTPQASAPKTDALGPKYTVTVLAKTAAQQVYDLYPMAAGGPRAYRPANQPTGKKADGWFYGRQTMQESLRLAGAPLKPKLDVVAGGIGGGVGQDVDVAQVDPMDTVQNVFGQMRELYLLNGAILVVILFGLAGTAFLIRRKV
jgi:hypothetical protein